MRIRLSVAVLLASGAAFAAAPGGPPARPDLDVTYISITPRPFSYMPNYDAGYGRPTDPRTLAVIPIEEAQAIPHYHEPGETVTFTAHVVNHGGLPTAPYNWAFRVDGQIIASGREETGLQADATPTEPSTYTLKGLNGNPVGYTYKTWGLKPGTWKNFSATWLWQDGPHKVRFEVSPDASTPAEISIRNNAREDYTNAMAFFITVKKGVQNVLGGTPPPTGYLGFRSAQNFTDTGLAGYPAGPGSYSFEDWLQYHVDLMHDKFAKSIWPAAPNGILEHIRIDEIVILDNAESREDPGVWRAVNGFDSAWPFGTYAAAGAQTKDWGLIHEWGHQLGLIDIYNLDLIPSDNYMRDTDGYFTGLGRTAHQQGMMRNHGDTIFSEFCAIGLNTQLGRRRGWYGDFQYLMAATNRVRVVDNAGGPVAGAQVTVYQSKPVTNTPVASGATDADGYFTLPNRPVTRHTTEYKPGETPYTEHDSPFGQVDVVGNRGILYLRVVSGPKREIFSLDVTDFVRAYALQGANTATFTLPTHFGPASAPAAPAGLSARLISSTGVSLSWQASPTAGVTGYRVYKGVEQEYLWQPIGETATASFTDTVNPQQMVRYAVAAVSAAGESSLSNEVAVYSYNDMRGIARSLDGTILVADTAREQPIWLRPDLSPIQTFGSVHNHASAWDVAVRPNGWITYGGNPASYVDVPSAGVMVLSQDGTQRISYSFRPNGPDVGQWYTPEGFSIGQGDAILVTDSTNRRVEVVDPYGYNTQWSFGTGALTRPIKTIQLPDGSYLTTDAGAGRVQAFDSGGNPSGTFATLAGPAYIARGSDGTIAVSQPSASTVALYHPDGSKWKDIVVAGDGSPLSSPRGVDFDADGRLLIADSGNRRVVRVSALTVPIAGDVDGNGVVDAHDAALALRLAAGLAAATPSEAALGDVLKTKAPGINLDDALAIARKAVQ